MNDCSYNIETARAIAAGGFLFLWDELHPAKAELMYLPVFFNREKYNHKERIKSNIQSIKIKLKKKYR